ncbi:MAG: hypothetical protein SPK23_03615 [Eubacteriales bacterium]|nr:hypothetical protein [Clostridiales bacterium]MDY5836195.1 hypothetical protein [Eubacteriales bacterium]
MARKQVKSTGRSQKKSSRQTSPATEPTKGTVESITRFWGQHPLGRLLLACLILIFAFFFNLLLSRDQLDIFSLLWGVEILLLMSIGWGLFLYRRYREREEDN